LRQSLLVLRIPLYCWCSVPFRSVPVFPINQVFLEETSLVARPAVPFPDLKERLEARMKWLGIKVREFGDGQPET
jgi:hypothetical protein